MLTAIISAAAVSSSNTVADPWGDAQSVTVTREITSAGGSLTSADNATHTIDLGSPPHLKVNVACPQSAGRPRDGRL